MPPPKNKLPPRRRKIAPKKSAKPKMTLEKRIKAISVAEQETKIKVFQVFDNLSILGVGLNNAGTKGRLINNIFGPPTFTMSQGTNQQERVGNVINHCTLNIKGFMHSMPVNPTTNVSVYPYEVHVLVYKTKQGSTGSPDTLLQYPNNTNNIITGSASSTLYPWNRKGYTIKKHKVFRLKANPVTGVSTIPNAIGLENPTYNGSKAEFFKRFNFDVNIKNDLTFNDDGVTPINDWCAIGCYIVNGDGSTLANNQERAKITIMATLKYKDS